jgi:hypothetical protein
MTTADRPSYSFDLAEEMIETLAEEFDPARSVGEAKARSEGKSGNEADEEVRAYFADHGRRLMERTIELSKAYPDQTEVVMHRDMEVTASDGWPFLAQRLMEIAFLGSQPIYTLPIVENGAYRFTWKLAMCETYVQVQEQMGDEAAKKLLCQGSCMTATKDAFVRNGFDVDVTAEARMPDDDYCQFTAPRVPRSDSN